MQISLTTVWCTVVMCLYVCMCERQSTVMKQMVNPVRTGRAERRHLMRRLALLLHQPPKEQYFNHFSKALLHRFLQYENQTVKLSCLCIMMKQQYQTGILICYGGEREGGGCVNVGSAFATFHLTFDVSSTFSADRWKENRGIWVWQKIRESLQRLNVWHVTLWAFQCLPYASMLLFTKTSFRLPDSPYRVLSHNSQCKNILKLKPLTHTCLRSFVLWGLWLKGIFRWKSTFCLVRLQGAAHCGDHSGTQNSRSHRQTETAHPRCCFHQRLGAVSILASFDTFIFPWTSI